MQPDRIPDRRAPSPVEERLTSFGGVRDLAGRWWEIMRSPRIRTFDRQRESARWPVVWASLIPLAVIEALGVAYVVYGPDAAAGYSSLPLGTKLHLPQTPLLPLAALAGSVAQFFIFSGLLWLIARLVGGRGSFATQSYLIALWWVPLMAASDVFELVPVVGATLGTLLRVYGLYLCVLAVASAHRLRLPRAFAAVLVLVFAGVLLGLVMLTVFGARVARFVA
ncbi:MAG TPA: Yip1 family protein [Ktedonobacterales bacterium]